ncbi:unnamed protein product [Auanema sp. JU1783]|nr:unnamed protein product [Auanema sp. JU1783]
MERFGSNYELKRWQRKYTAAWLVHERMYNCPVSSRRSKSATHYGGRVPIWDENEFEANDYLFNVPSSRKKAISYLLNMKHQMEKVDRKKKKKAILKGSRWSGDGHYGKDLQKLKPLIPAKSNQEPVGDEQFPVEEHLSLVKPRGDEQLPLDQDSMKELPNQPLAFVCAPPQVFTIMTYIPIMRPAYSSFRFIDYEKISRLETVANSKVIFENTLTIVKLTVLNKQFPKIPVLPDCLQETLRDLDLDGEIVEKRRKTSTNIQSQVSNFAPYLNSANVSSSGTEKDDETHGIHFEQVKDSSVSHLLPFLIRFYRRGVCDPTFCDGTGANALKAMRSRKIEERLQFAFWTKLFCGFAPEDDLFTSDQIFISNTSFRSLKKVDRKKLAEHEMTLEVLQHLDLNLKLGSEKSLKSQTLSYEQKKSVILEGKVAGVWTVEEQLELSSAWNKEEGVPLFPTLSLTTSYNLNAIDCGYIKIVTRCDESQNTIKLLLEIGETNFAKETEIEAGTDVLTFQAPDIEPMRDEEKEKKGSRSDLYLDESFINRLMKYYTIVLEDDRFHIVDGDNGKTCILIDASLELGPLMSLTMTEEEDSMDENWLVNGFPGFEDDGYDRDDDSDPGYAKIIFPPKKKMRKEVKKSRKH